MMLSPKKICCMYLLVKKVLIGKKEKATKCLFFPKTWGLGIGWRFSLHLRPYPHLQPQWKLGSKLLANFFLKCIFNLYAYLWKKRMPKPNQYYPKNGGWRFGQGHAFVCNLAPHPCPHLYMRRKKDKRFFWISFWNTILPLISTHEKKKLQKPIISPLNIEVQNMKKNSLCVCADVAPPSAKEKR